MKKGEKIILDIHPIVIKNRTKALENISNDEVNLLKKQLEINDS